MPCARDAALADAMREAVRLGVGIDVVSASGMHQFELVYDEVFTRSFGYLKRYEIIRNGIDSDGFYFVTIAADVEKGAPEADDTMTLQTIARMKGSPRIAVQIQEQIAGIPQSDTAGSLLRQAAAAYGLQVVDIPRTEQVNDVLSNRAKALGREQEAALRQCRVISECDYILKGTVIGSYTGEKSYYGSSPSKRFSLGFNADIIDAATGRIPVSESSPSIDITVRRVDSESAACREAVRTLMDGNPRSSVTGAGRKLLRRLFVHWLVEQDLGNVYKLEFIGLNLAAAQQLQSRLKENRTIGDVRIRSIDAETISVIDCEARLSPTELAALIESIASGYHLERSEYRYLSFRK